MLITAVLSVCGPYFIDGLTVDPGARAAARSYLPWAAAAPLMGVWAFQLDGIFIASQNLLVKHQGLILKLGLEKGMPLMSQRKECV